MVELEQLLEDAGAILRGHFILTSGRHSDIYFEKFRVLERPDVVSALVSAFLSRHAPGTIDVVAGPTTGGILIAFEAARQLGVRSVYVESENGEKMLRRGASIEAGARVLLVDDVLTTGLSLQESKVVIENAGGVVLAAEVLIDRSGGCVQLGCPIGAAYEVTAQSWSEEEIPDWLAKLPVTKPGTRPTA
ncbi:MAG: orotate phosphoribosyltransferase [Fimbriimonadaceae bacterium]|nr:orotate phosphoribosyltransferase [Fimbriimonadaceae bacterium]MBX3334581.1 orotate phosphoribosyltransferase [Nitrospira sp.]